MARKQTWMSKSLDVFLKEKGFVTDEQLQEIKQVKVVEGGGWAGQFVDSGCITENELLKLIISETGLPYFPLLRAKPQEELLQEFTIDFMETFECFPVDIIGPALILATPNPFQPELIRSRSSRARKILLVVTRVSEWRECIVELNNNQLKK